jgi:hypothetical protein
MLSQIGMRHPDSYRAFVTLEFLKVALSICKAEEADGIG